jgi:hypothetical protein
LPPSFIHQYALCAASRHHDEDTPALVNSRSIPSQSQANPKPIPSQTHTDPELV